MRNVEFSVPTAEILSTIMVSNYFHFLPIIGLHCLIRSSAPRTQPCKRSTGEAKNVLKQSSRGNGTESWRDVTVNPQPSFLPTLDHNIAPAHVKLLDPFARNRVVRRAKRPPPIDRRRLTNDPIYARK